MTRRKLPCEICGTLDREGDLRVRIPMELRMLPAQKAFRKRAGISIPSKLAGQRIRACERCAAALQPERDEYRRRQELRYGGAAPTKDWSDNELHPLGRATCTCLRSIDVIEVDGTPRWAEHRIPRSKTKLCPQSGKRAPRPRGNTNPAKASKGDQFEYKGHVLWGRVVTLKGGRTQTIYFFTRKGHRPMSGDPSPLPAGYDVAMAPRSGVPILRRRGPKWREQQRNARSRSSERERAPRPRPAANPAKPSRTANGRSPICWSCGAIGASVLCADDKWRHLDCRHAWRNKMGLPEAPIADLKKLLAARARTQTKKSNPRASARNDARDASSDVVAGDDQDDVHVDDAAALRRAADRAIARRTPAAEDFACPKCGRLSGIPCLNDTGGQRASPHRARRELARAAAAALNPAKLPPLCNKAQTEADSGRPGSLMPTDQP